MLYRKKTLTLKPVLIVVLIGIVLLGITLLYSQNFSVTGMIDAVFVAGFILFSFGWFFFISNENVFSFVIYGVQSFWLNIAGKTKDKTYYEYILEKPQISSHIYKSLWIGSAPFMMLGIILLFVYWGINNKMQTERDTRSVFLFK